MLMIPIALGAVVASALAWAYAKSREPGTPSAAPHAVGSVGNVLKKGINGMPSHSDMVEVVLGDEVWLVTPDYLGGPVGINEAAALVRSLGMVLPRPALVDAIWRQADLKLPPKPRNNVISEAVFEDQRRVIANQIGGRNFVLVAGQYKDVVNVNGHNEIYGWQVGPELVAMVNGKPTYQGVPLNKMVTPGEGLNIQPQSGKRHDQPGPIGFKDYSQGARGCVLVSKGGVAV